MKKRTAVMLLSLAMLLSFNLTALADQPQGPTPRLDSQIQKLQELKDRAAKLQPLKDEIKTIQALHQQVVAARKQVHSMYQDQLRPLLKQARQAKDYDAMIVALSDLKQVQTDLLAVKSLTDKNQGLWEQMRNLRENKDFSGALNSLKQIEVAVKAKLDAYNKATIDLTNVISELQNSAKQPAPTSPAQQ